MDDYGKCRCCGCDYEAIRFEENEYYPNSVTPTGRTRIAVSHLECPNCGTKECVDDTFDGPWK